MFAYKPLAANMLKNTQSRIDTKLEKNFTQSNEKVEKYVEDVSTIQQIFCNNRTNYARYSFEKNAKIRNR